MAESGTVASPTDPPPRRRGGKRTARACDECRMRKAKCDGLNPCETCQTTDRYCTYNLSAGRSTGSGTRIRILEDRLRRARAYLTEAQRRTPSLAQVDFDALLGPTDDSERETRRQSTTGDDENEEGQEKLESMMDSYGHMNLDSTGGMQRDFYGAASGLAFIQKTRNYFDDSESSANSGADDLEAHTSAVSQLFDAPLPPKRELRSDTKVSDLLPPRELTTTLLHVVFKECYPMLHYLDEDDFEDSTDRIYSIDPSQFLERDHGFLPLLYLVIALGYLFSREQHDRLGCRTSIAQAMRHFIAGRSLLDIAHLRTIASLQGVISLILFLISTARIVSGHAFLGAACASAMRQGLHFRSAHEIDIPERERGVRRRVFWAVMNLDMYISSILGLPQFMDLSAVDPAIDMTIEATMQEVRSDTGLSTGDGLALAASAKHIELMRIVFKAQRTLFPKPTDPPDAQKQNGAILVSVKKLQSVETQFQEWAQSLPDILSHPDDSVETQSIKYEVHIIYYFSQIVLYRAFLHYLAKQHEDESVGTRQLSYAKTCVRMAVKVVEVSIEHQRRGMLCPASWPSVYTVFMSTVCLIFAYATRKPEQAAPEVKTDIENAIRLLACTACTTDTGSVRCLEILRRLIKRVHATVDVDLDKICADTTPCCTAAFSPGKQQGRSSLAEFQVPSRHISEAGTTRSGSQVSSFAQSSQSGNNQPRWAKSPDITISRPSFTDHGSYSLLDYQAPQLNEQDEEMMELPYASTFGWQHQNMSVAGPGFAKSGSQLQDAHPHEKMDTTTMSPEELSSYMRFHDFDDSQHGLGSSRH